MPKDDELTEEDLTHSYKVGIYAGLDEAGNVLLQKATECFAEGNDNHAKLLRQLSVDFKKLAKERHPGPRAKKS